MATFKSDYQGHKNYATWAANMLIDGNYGQGDYDYFQDIKDMFIKKYGEEDVDVYKLADVIKDEFQTMKDDANLKGFFSDIVGTAIEEIDYKELAENLLEE